MTLALRFRLKPTLLASSELLIPMLSIVVEPSTIHCGLVADCPRYVFTNTLGFSSSSQGFKSACVISLSDYSTLLVR